MDKKKRSRKETSEERRRWAEDHPTIRLLRERAFHGMTPEEREAFLAKYRDAG
jgi:hypothetical protein